MGSAQIESLGHDVDWRKTGLGEILQQLQFRYELRFKPEALDGKPQAREAISTFLALADRELAHPRGASGLNT